MIVRIPFLRTRISIWHHLILRITNLVFKCRLLEDRGAAPTDVTDASVEAVKKADIYVGIFGDVYSNTTEREYDEAQKNFIPIFIYEKKSLKRQQALSRLLTVKIKPSFKKHPFQNNRGLYKMVIDNLEDFQAELVQKGLQKYQQDRQKLINEIRIGNKEISEADHDKEINAPPHILDEAYLAFEQKDYLTTLIKSSIAFEAWLRLIMQDRNIINASTGPLYQLIQRAQKLNILEPFEVNRVNELRIMRNHALYQRKVPSENEIQFILKTVSEIMKS
jgi:hypothetical protein